MTPGGQPWYSPLAILTQQAVGVLNRMLELGRPNYVRTA